MPLSRQRIWGVHGEARAGLQCRYQTLLTVAFGPFGLPTKVRETDCDNQKVESAGHFWSEEPSKIPGRRRIRARIGGLHCSLCTGMIEKALGRRPGVDKVAVSLTHEQALIE